MSYIKRILENLGSDPEEVRRRLLRKGIQHPAQLSVPAPGSTGPGPDPEPYAQPRPAPYPAPGRQRRTGAPFPAQAPTRTPDEINADLFGED